MIFFIGIGLFGVRVNMSHVAVKSDRGRSDADQVRVGVHVKPCGY